MIKAGAFPFQKGIESFGFDFQPSVKKEQIQDFTTLRFLENRENIVFLGSSGVGKTHLAPIALKIISSLVNKMSIII